MENSVAIRIKELMEHFGLNKNSLSKAIGLGNNVTIGRIVNENREPSYDVLRRIIQTYGSINPTWLLTGEGPMLLRGQVIREPAEAAEEPVAKFSSKKDHSFPLVEFKAVAGFGSGDFAIGDRDVKEWYVIPKFRHKKIDFMIEVEGSSMYPKYNSGDVVACKIIQPDRFIQWNKTHVISTKDQGIIIKRIKPGSSDRTLTMVSDNQQYDPFEVNIEEITGLALVIGVIRLE